MMSKRRASQDYKLNRLSNHYGYSSNSFPFVGLQFPGLHFFLMPCLWLVTIHLLDFVILLNFIMEPIGQRRKYIIILFQFVVS